MLRVELVVPDREVWSGRATMVIAKTLEGDIGVMSGHPPVFGLLAEGSLVRILDPELPGGESSEPVVAAVSSGFFAVRDDRVSILAADAQLGSQVDTAAVRSALAATEPAATESPEVRYSRALLRAAGEPS
jgi:F-type H+-transporting ATPase subunit epsilon